MFEKVDNFIYNHPVYSISILIFSVILFTFLVVNIAGNVHKAKCLASDIPRRWRNGICEEYYRDEWLQINPFTGNDIYYNEAAEAKE